MKLYIGVIFSSFHYPRHILLVLIINHIRWLSCLIQAQNLLDVLVMIIAKFFFILIRRTIRFFITKLITWFFLHYFYRCCEKSFLKSQYFILHVISKLFLFKLLFYSCLEKKIKFAWTEDGRTYKSSFFSVAVSMEKKLFSIILYSIYMIQKSLFSH